MATLIFCCGAECGIVGVGGATTLPKHWDVATGTAPTILTTNQRPPGLRCYQFATSAATGFLTHNIVAGNRTTVLRLAVRTSVRPGVTTTLVNFTGPASVPGLRISSAGVLIAKISTTEQTGPTLALNTWAVVELKAVTSGTTTTLDWYVDGVAQTQVTLAGQTAADMTALQVGVVTSSTMTLQVDDIALSVTAGDWPLGMGCILGYSPNVDGAHSFTANDFKYNNTTTFLYTATDINTYVDEVPLTSISDFISQNVVNAVGYVQVGFANLVDGGVIKGVEVVSAMHASATGANTCTLKLNDGTTLSDVYALGDFSNTAITYHSKHYPLNPTGGAWSSGIFDALLARWGYATDVVGIPFLDAIMLEVDLIINASVTVPGPATAPAASVVPVVTPGVEVVAVVATAPAASVTPTATGTAVVAGALATAPAAAIAPAIGGTAEVTAVMSTAVAAGIAPAVVGEANANVLAPMAACAAQAEAPAVTPGVVVIATVGAANAEALVPTVTPGVEASAVLAEAIAEAEVPIVTGTAAITSVVAGASADAMSPAVAGAATIAAEVCLATVEALAPTVTGTASVVSVVAGASAEAAIPALNSTV